MEGYVYYGSEDSCAPCPGDCDLGKKHNMNNFINIFWIILSDLHLYIFKFCFDDQWVFLIKFYYVIKFLPFSLLMMDFLKACSGLETLTLSFYAEYTI